METGFAFAKLDPGAQERFVSLRRDLGVTTFGINQIRLARGQRGRIHRHLQQEEVYLVIAGTLTLWIEGEEHTLHAGEIARVAPEVRRQLANRHDADLILLALGGAERAHRPRRRGVRELGGHDRSAAAGDPAARGRARLDGGRRAARDDTRGPRRAGRRRGAPVRRQ